mmetsp:Transcript_20436/g.31244  ORF Transcript_20436/g.31244 Transcript_20436/m.31244 type:complete len:216 (+) Transcript_20436:64-711(+)
MATKYTRIDEMELGVLLCGRGDACVPKTSTCEELGVPSDNIAWFFGPSKRKRLFGVLSNAVSARGIIVGLGLALALTFVASSRTGWSRMNVIVHDTPDEVGRVAPDDVDQDIPLFVEHMGGGGEATFVVGHHNVTFRKSSCLQVSTYSCDVPDTYAGEEVEWTQACRCEPGGALFDNIEQAPDYDDIADVLLDKIDEGWRSIDLGDRVVCVTPGT